uniref:ABC transmembrane type-1 domain-containing protein n=2 Tax=Photinus pyralis TaxID=7054 RepID=A0A1Y1N121_PHOPY
METEFKVPKKRNFRENVNPFSALFFLHMFPVFQRNCKKGLKETDLCDVLDEQKAILLGDKLESIWKKEFSSDKKLHKSLFRMFGFEFVIYGVLQFVNELTLVALLPLAVGEFISYFEEKPTEGSEANAYTYAALIVFCILLNAFVNHSTAMGLMHISMKMAIACSSFIYRKSLTLTHTRLVQVTSGHILNLLSTDVSHLEYGLLVVHYIWISPIQVVVGIYLLYRVIGVAAFLGISLHLLYIPLQSNIFISVRKSPSIV